VRIPLEFRRLQAADLSDWHGERSHEELEHFFQSIEANVGHAGSGTALLAPTQVKRGAPLRRKPNTMLHSASSRNSGAPRRMRHGRAHREL
jgi:hypothetical protein